MSVKRVLLILECIILTSAMVFAAVFSSAGSVTALEAGTAFNSLEFMKASGVTTEITDIYGNTRDFNGMLKTESLENNRYAYQIQSYTIQMNGKSIIEIEPHDLINSSDIRKNYSGNASSSVTGGAANGYYSITFPVEIEGKTCEAFLTGLTETPGEGSLSISQIEDWVTQALLEKKDYLNLENADFIDTEKIYYRKNNDSWDYYDDTALCWAGTAANMLHYSGWAAQAIKDGTNKDVSGNSVAMSTEDEIFDLFMEAFTNNGGKSFRGIEWFFNGYYSAQSWADLGWSTVDSEKFEHGKFQGFLPYYPGMEFCYYVEASSGDNVDFCLESLRLGDSVGMGIDWCDKNESDEGYTRTSGHAITLWGYIIDPSLDADNPQRYKKLMFADSDNNVSYYYGTKRSDSPNTISLVTLEYVTVTVDNKSRSGWRFKGYDNPDDPYYPYIGLLSEFEILEKYSDDIVPDKGENAGTHNVFEDPDLSHMYLGIYIDKALTEEQYVFTAEEATAGVYFGDIMYNQGLVNFSAEEGTLKHTITLKRNGTVEATTEINTNGISSRYYRYFSCDINNIKALTAGDYELIIEYNSDKKYPEAFRVNNTASVKFKVLPDVYCSAQKSGKNLKISFSPETDGIYIAAAYNADGKMTGVNYFSSAKAGASNECTLSNAADSTKVKVFEINADNTPKGNVMTAAVEA